jgi:FkbH-like protein
MKGYFTNGALPETISTPLSKKLIKAVVWDLDNTLWDGTLIEDKDVKLREDAVEIVRTLDHRGILQSIASKNDADLALAKLEELGIRDYFLHPQIHWNSKTISLKNIAQSLNIGIDSLAFVDDQRFEREEVQFSSPEVVCIDALKLDGMLEMPELNPRFITDDSKNRRRMYISDQSRQQAEDMFLGTAEEFLASLDMVLTISAAKEEDLKRAEELTIRTNQLNSTGRTYSFDELNHFRESPHHLLLICSLEDKYGGYGNIGLALVESFQEHLTIKLLLLSCRVMSRGIGTILISHIMNLAKSRNKSLYAEFLPNERNRAMYVTYKFSGFREERNIDGLQILANDLSVIRPFPGYMKVQIQNNDCFSI